MKLFQNFFDSFKRLWSIPTFLYTTVSCSWSTFTLFWRENNVEDISRNIFLLHNPGEKLADWAYAAALALWATGESLDSLEADGRPSLPFEPLCSSEARRITDGIAFSYSSRPLHSLSSLFISVHVIVWLNSQGFPLWQENYNHYSVLLLVEIMNITDSIRTALLSGFRT